MAEGQSSWRALQDAVALLQEGRLGQALERFDAMTQSSTGERGAAVATHRGATFELMRRDGEALAAFHQAIERYGRLSSPEGQYYIATCMARQAHILIRLGRPHEAQAAINRLVDVFGQTPEPQRRQLVQETAHLRTRLRLRERLYLRRKRRAG